MGAKADRRGTSDQAAGATAYAARPADCYCPFLNRADARCSTHFRLDRLDQAFEHCFDRYHGCAVYRELLGERRSRRTAAFAALQVRSAMADGDGGFDPAADGGWAWERQLARSAPLAPAAHARTSLVQLALTRRTHRPPAQRHGADAQQHRPLPHAHSLPPAAGEGVSAAPGV